MLPRIKELVELLNKAARAYYQEDRQEMSDNDYDKLYDELVQLENSTGIVLSNSPTQNVGYEVLGNLQKVKHESKMLSLDKTKEVEKLKAWIEDQIGLLSWKLDGLTIVLKYNNGVLSQAITRGSGEIGEDITHNARVFKNIPLKINFEHELVLRGEAVINYSDFKKINEEIEQDDQYKNPRNLCSGTVRQLNSEIAAKRNVMFYAFTLVKAEGKEFDGLKSSQLNWLNELGFNTVEHKKVTVDTIDETVRWFEAQIPHNDFASDGLVLTYDDIEYSHSLGTTSKFPKDSIAFKWADEMAETKLIKVHWSTSRTGRINPVAIFEPVELEGTTVNKASLHNISILEELKLGVGDTIKVYKANMIIPQVAENLTCSDTIEIPTQCPVCQEETEIRALREGKALYCNNPNCRAQLIRALQHFVNRDAMNIEGLSVSTLEKFVESEFIKDYTDIYSLEHYAQQIKSMEGFGEKSYQNLIDAIEKSKNVELPNFIYALGIKNVGLSNAKLLCKRYDYDVAQIITADEMQLNDIEGFGAVIAHELHKYFNNEQNLQLLNKALSYLNIAKPLMQQSNLILEGKTFVITGDVNYFNNRKELQTKIEQLGGKVSGSVSNKTSYLINNDNMSASSKNKKATELNIPIITEEEFINMIAQK
jgi:DNA ligase (NAD+)